MLLTAGSVPMALFASGIFHTLQMVRLNTFLPCTPEHPVTSDTLLHQICRTGREGHSLIIFSMQDNNNLSGTLPIMKNAVSLTYLR